MKNAKLALFSLSPSGSRFIYQLLVAVSTLLLFSSTGRLLGACKNFLLYSNYVTLCFQIQPRWVFLLTFAGLESPNLCFWGKAFNFIIFSMVQSLSFWWNFMFLIISYQFFHMIVSFYPFVLSWHELPKAVSGSLNTFWLFALNYVEPDFSRFQKPNSTTTS